MYKGQRPQGTPKHQLDELLEDYDFARLIDLITKEVKQLWKIPYDVGRRVALSAIGDPMTLAVVHGAWWQAKQGRVSLGLVKRMVRLRVIDLLKKDARRPNHCSLSTAPVIEGDAAPGSFQALGQRDPRTELELRELIGMVRAALVCFARPGPAHERQALLLRQYALEERTYAELNGELQCSTNALRVRVHKAMAAFRGHIKLCHPELEELLERTRRR